MLFLIDYAKYLKEILLRVQYLFSFDDFMKFLLFYVFLCETHEINNFLLFFFLDSHLLMGLGLDQEREDPICF